MTRVNVFTKERVLGRTTPVLNGVDTRDFDNSFEAKEWASTKRVAGFTVHIIHGIKKRTE